MDCPVVDYPQWLRSLDDDTFEVIADATEQLLAIHKALSNDGLTVQGELFRDRGDAPIHAWAHYPADDFRDPESGAMFYYHAHDPEDWPLDEHGHFHLFVRKKAAGDFSHVAAISMTANGIPHALFATNGWVTDEKMLPADEVLRLLENRWEINRARPSWLVVQWLNAMLELVRPHIGTLLYQRDQLLHWTAGNHAHTAILDDRNTHILSELTFDFTTLLENVQKEAIARIG